jgi:lipoate-protein ligase A
MRYIEPESKEASYHFAVEEYLTETRMSGGPVLMLWQTDKTVMIGSNQVVKAEIDEKICAANDVKVVRRRSGGGTIFTDPGTLLYTIILPFSDEDDAGVIIREQVAAPIVAALASMGVPASLEGRNDILVDGRKVSGLAQFVNNGMICSHGSLLYDADLDLLAQVLDVDPEKIRSKALRSVRSRVTNLKEYMTEPLSTQGFFQTLKKHLFEANSLTEYRLSEEEQPIVLAIKQSRFDSPGWTYGRTPRYTLKNVRRYPGGKFEVCAEVKQGIVVSCNLCGDFLGLSPIRELEQIIEGERYDSAAISAAVDRSGKDISRYLGSLTKADLMDCLFA